MTLLLDIFGFVSVALEAASATSLVITVGSIIFLIALAKPLGPKLGLVGQGIIARTRSIVIKAALALAAIEGLRVACGVAVLTATTGMTVAEAQGAAFVRAGLVLIVASLAVAAKCATRFDDRRPLLLPLTVVLMLVAATLSSHGAARPEDQLALIGLQSLHLLGVSAWIGGLPCFLIALALCGDGMAWQRIGIRFSLIAFLSVATLAVAGVTMATWYIDQAQALYGTAYGVMLSIKVLLFGVLLLFGARNATLVGFMHRDSEWSVLRLRRFAEVELGIGIIVIVVAASLSSLPPAVDLTHDRLTAAEIIERVTPNWPPRLVSPDPSTLAIFYLQAAQNAQAKAGGSGERAMAYVPGGAMAPPHSAADIAWSEFNHHWAGIAVVLIGLLALLERSGRARWAGHWPLLLLVLAGFLFLRADPGSWPQGAVGFWDSLSHPQVAQLWLFTVLIIVLGLLEWRVRRGTLGRTWVALVFPLLVVTGGAILLTHSHSLANIKQDLLIEYSQLPIALLGIAGGWARWLELRLAPGGGRLAGWVWPLTFVLIGLALLGYREI
ncbi:copper resistance protein D [uncultured Gammaproteobacteria bacterium]